MIPGLSQGLIDAVSKLMQEQEGLDVKYRTLLEKWNITSPYEELSESNQRKFLGEAVELLGKEYGPLNRLTEKFALLGEQRIDEVLGKKAKSGDYVHDFVHSKNKKFKGKDKKERIKMALGAFYGNKKKTKKKR